MNDVWWGAAPFAPTLPAVAAWVHQHAVHQGQPKPFPWGSSASLSFEMTLPDLALNHSSRRNTCYFKKDSAFGQG